MLMEVRDLLNFFSMKENEKLFFVPPISKILLQALKTQIHGKIE